jgi:hypothetical protein
LFSLLFFSRAPLPRLANSFGRSAVFRKPGKKPESNRREIGQKATDETILRNPRNDPETDRAYVSSQQRAALAPREAHMNHSIHSADRTTHLKIVVVALVAGIAVAAFGISARSGSDFTQTAHVTKAGKPVVVTSSDLSMVR